jgi:sulfur-oxidizing protein SoxA
MKPQILALTAAALLFVNPAVRAAPEDDRLKVVKHFQGRYPDIRQEDYVHGASIFDPDAMAQVRGITEAPPYAGELAQGEKLWNTPLKNGKTYADCLPNGGRNIAGNYPLFDAAKGRVVTFEDALNACRVANGDAAYPLGDAATMGRLTTYARALSDGMKMNIRVDSPAALQAYEDGKRTFYARAGQLNFSCAHCHIDNVGSRLRSELLSPVLGQATHWPVFRGGDQLVTLQAYYQHCYQKMRHVPDEIGSVRFNNLEYFHAYLSNGLPLRAAVFRK